MNLAFVNVSAFNGKPFARMMVESARKHLPDTNLMQIGDRTSQTVHGISAIVRGDFIYQENTFPRYFLEVMANLNVPFSYCDTDLVFMGDIRPLLEEDFDVAICRRCKNDGSTRLYRTFHPYNAGLILVKNLEFWQACWEAITAFETSSPDLAQYVIGLVVNSGEFKVKLLDGDIYNRSPENVDDFDPAVKVWHFKGIRKEWMPEWVRRHGQSA